MFTRGWWIAAAGALAAVVFWIVLATRGPAPGRAPVQRPGEAGEVGATGALARGGASIRVAIGALPAGTRPEWLLEARDAAGGLHEEKGTGERECLIGGLSAGRVRCSVRAPGFVGDSVGVEAADGRETTGKVTLRQLGRVAGVARCEGVPVAGVLVRLSMPADLGPIQRDLVPEDRPIAAGWSVETDSAGRYRFDRVPPGDGYKLVAAGFDYPPVHGGPVDVRIGEETAVDFAMKEGGHLAGRVVDCHGAPCAGATVHIHVRERNDRGNLVTWVDEARARTERDGGFVTPALAGTSMRMLKLWIVVDGVQQVIQHETPPPERGTKDVGTLVPHPGIVQFEMEGVVAGDPSAILTVAVNGDPPGVGQSIVLAGVVFDTDGRIRMAGFPTGEAFYSVASADGRAVGDGQFRTTGSDMVVRIPALRQREEAPQPKEQFVVDVAETADPALLLLIADGSIVLWREIGTGNREPVVEKVLPGKYTLFVRAGDRYGQQEVTQVAGQDLRTSITPDRIGRSASVLVLDDGKPVPGATVRVRGFCKGSRGMRAPWAKAGSDGRAVIRGLPPDVEALTIVAFDATGEFAKGYSIDIGGTEDVTVDLAT